MKKNVFSFVLLTFACCSCSHHSSQVKTYVCQDTVYVNTHGEDGISIDSCEITKVIPLAVPESFLDFGNRSKLIFKNNRIYILDMENNRNAVAVFDVTGKFLYKVGGEIGRSKSELIGDVECFDVDGNNKLHLYDRSGRKVLVFNDEGKFDHAVMLSDYLPSSMAVAEDGNFYYFSLDYFSSSKGNTSLVVIDRKGKIVNTLYSLDVISNKSDGDNRPLSKGANGVVSYLPSLADFVLNVKGDSVSRTNFVFDRGFLTEEEICEARKTQRLTTNPNHVTMITSYFQNDSFLYMEYVLGDYIQSLLIDKVRHRSYNIDGVLGFAGFCTCPPIIVGDEFMCLITPFDIDFEKQNLEGRTGVLIDALHPVRKKMVLGEISTPAIVFAKLK